MRIPMNVLALGRLAAEGRGNKRWLLVESLKGPAGVKVASASDGHFLACLAWADPGPATLEEGQRLPVSPDACAAAWQAMGGKAEARKGGDPADRGTTCRLILDAAGYALRAERRYADPVTVGWALSQTPGAAYFDWREAFAIRAEKLAGADGTPRPFLSTPRILSKRLGVLDDAGLGSWTLWSCPKTAAAAWHGWVQALPMLAFGLLMPGEWDDGHERSGTVGHGLAQAEPFLASMMEAIARVQDDREAARRGDAAPIAPEARQAAPEPIKAQPPPDSLEGLQRLPMTPRGDA